MDDDKHIIELLECGEMLYEYLIVHCQNYFRYSGTPKRKMRQTDDDRNLEDKQNKGDAN